MYLFIYLFIYLFRNVYIVLIHIFVGVCFYTLDVQ